MRLAVHQVGPPQAPPVVLVPGMFSNRFFWIGTRGVGFARALAEAGRSAWVLEPRGHGESERDAARRVWRFEDWARCDVPAAIRLATAGGTPAIVAAHSAGGPAVMLALAADAELRERVAGLVLLACPAPIPMLRRRLLAAGVALLSHGVGRFPARALRMGPEDEVGGVMAQWMGWNALNCWHDSGGVNRLTGLKELRMPILAVAGGGDRLWAPAAACWALLRRTASERPAWLLCARSTGFSADFSHPGLVVSAAARREVWPRLVEWIIRTSPDRN